MATRNNVGHPNLNPRKCKKSMFLCKLHAQLLAFLGQWVYNVCKIVIKCQKVSRDNKKALATRRFGN